MILARVDGVIVSTLCHSSLIGYRTVICQPLDESGTGEGAPILALDPLSTGQHQRVLISTDGTHARAHVQDPHSPLRNMVIAIVDQSEKEAG